MIKKKEESTCQWNRQTFSPWPRQFPRATEQLRLCVTTPEPAFSNYQSHEPRAHAPQQEQSLQWEARAPPLESSAPSPQLEKALVQQQRLSAATIKKEIRKKTRPILLYVHLKNPVVDTEVGASLYSFNSRILGEILGEANKNHITGYIKTLEQLPRHCLFLETTFLRELTSEL